MTRYATSTPEARELVSELSFVWDQIKSMSPQQSSSSEEETLSRSRRLRRQLSRPEDLVDLEPRSSETRDWEGAVFSDGGEEASETSDRRFRRRVNRALESLRADVNALKEDKESRRPRKRPGQRDGILVAIGKWIVRFVGVFPFNTLLI
jgi:hypothetical protein